MELAFIRYSNGNIEQGIRSWLEQTDEQASAQTNKPIFTSLFSRTIPRQLRVRYSAHHPTESWSEFPLRHGGKSLSSMIKKKRKKETEEEKFRIPPKSPPKWFTRAILAHRREIIRSESYARKQQRRRSLSSIRFLRSIEGEKTREGGWVH